METQDKVEMLYKVEMHVCVNSRQMEGSVWLYVPSMMSLSHCVSLLL